MSKMIDKDLLNSATQMTSPPCLDLQRVRPFRSSLIRSTFFVIRSGISLKLFTIALKRLCRASAHTMIFPFDNPPPDKPPRPSIVGPDGLWYGITVATGANPMEFVTMFPIFNASTSWLIGAVTCEHSIQSCAHTEDTYYDSTSQSASYTPLLDIMENSSAVQFSDIYQPAGPLLNTTSSFGHWLAESFITAPDTDDLNP